MLSSPLALLRVLSCPLASCSDFITEPNVSVPFNSPKSSAAASRLRCAFPSNFKPLLHLFRRRRNARLALTSRAPQALVPIACASAGCPRRATVFDAVPMMAPIQANPDGGEDVNDFLQRIREQNDNRDQEDEARTKRLEEEILQARRERQARRAGTCRL